MGEDCGWWACPKRGEGWRTLGEKGRGSAKVDRRGHLQAAKERCPTEPLTRCWHARATRHLPGMLSATPRRSPPSLLAATRLWSRCSLVPATSFFRPIALTAATIPLSYFRPSPAEAGIHHTVNPPSIG